MWQYLRKLLGWRTEQEEWDAGYKWAVDAYTRERKSLEEIEQMADNAWDFREFDKGALEAISDLKKLEGIEDEQ